MEALAVIAALFFIVSPFILMAMISSMKNRMNSEFDLIKKRLDDLSGERPIERKPIEKVVVVERPAPKVEMPAPKPEPVVVKAPEPIVAPPPPPKKIEPPKPGFFERNPDLEKFIGENLANKIGIGILVIGIGFFVKYAIDQDWINEVGRVFIGILCGGILLGLAHRLRNSLPAFSSVLVGGGIAVLYLTIYIAFHTYGMFTQTVAFLLMVGITGFGVLFSLMYDRVELAVIAVLGGFASPLMVSTGAGNYVVLFTYITILDVGMMVLSYYKRWPLINIVSYVFTVILFASWMTASFAYGTPGMIAGALVFATIFYLVFFAMNIINNLKERRAFGPLEFALLLSNTFLYYGAGMYVLNNPVGFDFRGLFTVALGVFNFLFAFSLYKNSRVDKNLTFLLIGLVLTFSSLAAPIQLEGNYITLFWAAEAVLLLWLSQKSGIQLMKLTSLIVMVLMVISLVMDLAQVYSGMRGEISIILNKGYLTCMFVVASFSLTLMLLKNEKDIFVPTSVYRSLVLVAAILLVYVMNLLELRHHILIAYPDDVPFQTLAVGCYNIFFLLALQLAQKRLAISGNVRDAFAFIGLIAVLSYIYVYYRAGIDARHNMIFEGNSSAFWLHYLFVALLIPVCGIAIADIKRLTEFNLRTGMTYSWFYVSFFVFLASVELDNIVLLAVGSVDNMDHVISQNHKIGFPILWGITSFLLIAIGLKWKLRHLRIISLALFAVTLVKLFAVDIRGISEGGKIAAFISLGILLLTVSFMYQRLKKILLADDSAKENKPAA